MIRDTRGEARDEFDAAVSCLRDARLRPEVRLDEMPAPQRIAPYAVALSAEVVDPLRDDDPIATGRFIVLHDPAGPDPWHGTWRVVSYASAQLEPELAGDPLLGEVGWTWLTDALDDVDYIALGGTVTRVVSESFAGLADREPSVEMELRASWTPLGDLSAHLAAWSTMLCTVGGLPPLPEGVVSLPAARRG